MKLDPHAKSGAVQLALEKCWSWKACRPVLRSWLRDAISEKSPTVGKLRWGEGADGREFDGGRSCV